MSTGPGNDRGEAVTTRMPTDAGAPTEALVAGAVGDRCVNCGAPLSSDQRYCINCGERRGQPRFTLAQQQKSAAADTAASPAGLSRKSRIFGGATPRMSGGATLVAGVGTLLLAMGVGVLIGHNSAASNNAGSKAAATPQVITVQGGGSSPGSGASASAGTGGSSGSSSSGSSGAATGSHAKHKSSTGKSKHKGAASASAKKSADTPPPVVVKKVQQAATKVLGGSNTPPPTVTQGQKGSGPGFNKKTHKFDGSFFGG